jgi:hypothetical protein
MYSHNFNSITPRKARNTTTKCNTKPNIVGHPAALATTNPVNPFTTLLTKRYVAGSITTATITTDKNDHHHLHSLGGSGSESHLHSFVHYLHLHPQSLHMIILYSIIIFEIILITLHKFDISLSYYNITTLIL